MGAPTSTQVFGFGRLIAAPTTSDPDTAYGGIVLGTVGGVALRPRTRFEPLIREDLGGQTADLLFLNHEIDAVCVFSGWDTDALARAFYATSSGLVNFPGSKNPGSWISDQAAALLYAPDDSAAPGWYLPRAVAVHDRLEIPFSGFLPVALAMRFVALPPASGDLGKIGPVSALLGAWV